MRLLGGPLPSISQPEPNQSFHLGKAGGWSLRDFCAVGSK